MPLLGEGAKGRQLGAVLSPVCLLQLTQEWTEHKKSEEHQNAIKKSKPRKAEQEKLNDRLHKEQKKHKRGANLSRMVLANSISFVHLSEDDQKLVEDYDCERSARIVESLLAEKRSVQKCSGAGVMLC